MNHYKTVKELPLLERPYEKCMEFGPQQLSDAELLAVMLKCGTKEKTSVELAREILSLNEHYEGLAGIYQLSYDELTSVKGIGPVKAIQIMCIGEISKRILRASAKERLQCNCAKTVADYLMEEMRFLEKEEVRLLLLDSRHGLIRETQISVGTVNAALSSPREVYLEALKAQAVYVILIHNHPSGAPTPSNQDVIMTKRMKQAGDLLGIVLSDHIIIGNQSYYSFRENEHILTEH